MIRKISTNLIDGLNKAVVGLPNIDNTSDISKPISSLTQVALDSKLTSSILLGDMGTTLIGYKIDSPGAILRNLRDRMIESVSVKDFGANGENDNDDSTAFENAITYVQAAPNTRKLIIPGSTLGYRLTRPLIITKSIQIEGSDGWVPYAGNYGDRATPERGSWIKFDHAGIGIKVGTGVGSASAMSGLTIRNIGFQRPFQPSPAGDNNWSPIDNDFDIELSSVDCILENLMFLGTCRGIKVRRGNFGRLNARNIFGHFFKQGLDIQHQYDLCMVNNFRAWPFWSLNNQVGNYTTSQLRSIVVGRVDNPFFSNIFSIAHNTAIDVIQSVSEGGEYPSGSMNKGKFVNLDLDLGQYGIRVAPDIQFCELDIANLSIQGDNRVGISHAIDVSCNSARVGITNFDARDLSGNAIRCLTGSGNNITLTGRIYVNGFSKEPNSDFPAFEFAAGNTLNVVGWPVIENNLGTGPIFGGAGVYRSIENSLFFSQEESYSTRTIQSRLSQEVWVTDAPFNALGNGSFNCTTAIQAAIDLLALRGGGTVRIPAGNFICGAIDRKANVIIQGAGKQATRLIAPNGFDASMFTSIGSISGSVSWGGIRDLTIVGTGRTNTGMVGIDHRWTNRAMVRDVDIFGCRKGMYIENVWQDTLDNVHVHGGGTDQSYIGFHLGPKDPTPGISNAVVANNCLAQNVEAYGFRLENYDGSKFISCEGMNGIHGWYLGDPSTGTEACQFGHFTNCLADTNSGHNWRIEKGNAGDIRQAQFANCWAGTSTSGDNVYVAGASQLIFSNWQAVAANQNAFRFFNSSRCTLSNSSLRDYNKSTSTGCGVLLENSAAIKVVGNQVYTQSTGTGSASKETGSSNYNDISGNNLSNATVIIGANSQALNNILI